MAPQTIGRFRILRELGRGAAATVYLARDPGSGRQVAVKILSPAFTATPDFAARFEQTLKALASLDHPYLVTPHDYGRDDDQYFLAMRYLPGGTLADRMDGRPMLLAEVVPILQRLSEALDAAHTAHLVHGDLHPAEVLFDLRERAYLADLGLAPLLDPVPGPSPTGTAAYMSPEQIAGQPIDGRADVYALGILLFEMLTGRQPFSGATPQQLLRQHLEQPVPQLSTGALAHLVLPLEFNLVIARALAKNRDTRYPTAGVLAEAVRTMFLMPPADSAQEPAAPSPAPAVALPTMPPPAAQAAPPPALTAPATSEAGANADSTSGAASMPVGGDSTLAAVPVVPSATPDTAGPVAPPPPILPPGEAPSAATPEPTPEPEPARAAAAPIPTEIVRSPAPAAPRPRRGPAPGTLLLGLAGIGLVLIFLASLRWPAIRAFILAPTPTATATLTPVPTSTPTATPSATPTATASNTATATASPTQTASPTATATTTLTPAPTDTVAPTSTPTRRPTLPPFTATAVPAGSLDTLAAPTQSHLGPPPTGAP